MSDLLDIGLVGSRKKKREATKARREARAADASARSDREQDEKREISSAAREQVKRQEDRRGLLGSPNRGRRRLQVGL